MAFICFHIFLPFLTKTHSLWSLWLWHHRSMGLLRWPMAQLSPSPWRLWQLCNFLRIKCLTKISLPLPEASQLNPKQRPVSLFSSSAAQRISPVFTQHEQVMSGHCFERACGMSNMHELMMRIINDERRSGRSGIHIPILSVLVTQPQLNPCSVHSCIPPLSCRDNKDSHLPKGLLVPKVLVFILFIFTHVHHGLLAAKG